MFNSGAVLNTSELKRILALPQRNALDTGTKVIDEVTAALKKPEGRQTLFPLQALALAEIAVYEGAVVILPVGEGKTLISYLVPSVLLAERPLLLIPAQLKEKTVREFRALSEHWQEPPNGINIQSYEKLSTDPELLRDYKPDLIVADECHKLKNRKAGCTKRLHRYWQEHDFAFIPMSGTLTKRSFMDWWLLQLIALPDELLVLPSDYREAEMWAEALDEKLKMRRPRGALTAFGNTLQECREGYGRHIRGVPCIIGAEGAYVDCALRIEIKKFEFDSIEKHLDDMNNLWALPDGTEFSEAVDLWRHSVEMSQGFYYVWKEPPPAPWLAARSAFNKLVRDTLAHSKKFETPGQVVDFWKSSTLPQELKVWLGLKDTFKPKTESVFFDASLVDMAVARAAESETLFWVAHTAMGEALESRGIPYFHMGGRTNSGLHIYDHDGSAAVSAHALTEGFNLQKWSKNVLLSCPTGGNVFEQLLGRTHRRGQEADYVEVEIWVTGRIQEQNFKQALSDAKYIQGVTGQRQKLCYADVIMESRR